MLKINYIFESNGKVKELMEKLTPEIFEKKYGFDIKEFIDENGLFINTERMFFKFSETCDVVKVFMSHSKQFGGVIFHIYYDEEINRVHIIMEYRDYYGKSIELKLYDDFIVEISSPHIYFTIEE